MLARVHGIEVELQRLAGRPPATMPTRDAEVLRIANEALHNAVRHAARQRT